MESLTIAPPAKSRSRKALVRCWKGLKALCRAIRLAWAYYIFWSAVWVFVLAGLAIFVPPFFGHHPDEHAVFLLCGAAELYAMGWAANRIGRAEP